MMKLSAIVAADEQLAIGKGNQMPWHLPDDLKFFKKTTMGKPVLMGRKTYDSLGRPLPGRLNIVVTKSTGMTFPEEVCVYGDLNEALERMRKESAEEGFVIGGGEIFKLLLPQFDRIYFTRVHTTVPEAEVYFPDFSEEQWKLTQEEFHPADDRHPYSFTFQQFDRI
jgi:dihydrofolate reductase